jgi:hypothetical protein
MFVTAHADSDGQSNELKDGRSLWFVKDVSRFSSIVSRRALEATCTEPLRKDSKGNDPFATGKQSQKDEIEQDFSARSRLTHGYLLVRFLFSNKGHEVLSQVKDKTMKD